MKFWGLVLQRASLFILLLCQAGVASPPFSEEELLQLDLSAIQKQVSDLGLATQLVQCLHAKTREWRESCRSFHSVPLATPLTTPLATDPLSEDHLSAPKKCSEQVGDPLEKWSFYLSPDCNKIYFWTLPESPFDKGGCKRVDLGFKYDVSRFADRWEELVRLSMKPVSWVKRVNDREVVRTSVEHEALYRKRRQRFIREGEVQKKISQLPPSQRIGLLYSEYVDYDQILQTRFAGTVSDLIYSRLPWDLDPRKEKDKPRARGPALTRGQMLQLASQAVRGTLELHRIGEVNNDIKPENLLVNTFRPGDSRRMVGKLTDFGFNTRVEDILAHSGGKGSRILQGTFMYMPPERFNAKTEYSYIGSTPQIRLDNELKSDLFSTVISLGLLLVSDDLAGYQNNFDFGTGRGWSWLKGKLEARHKPIETLLAQNMAKDPEQRKLPEEFFIELDQLIRMELLQQFEPSFLGEIGLLHEEKPGLWVSRMLYPQWNSETGIYEMWVKTYWQRPNPTELKDGVELQVLDADPFNPGQVLEALGKL